MKRRTKSNARKAEPAGSLALLVIDSTEVRKKARREYERVLTQLNQAREEFDRFERLDKPEYVRWMHAQFGPLLTQMREVAQELAIKREMLFQIETEAFFSGVSLARAYQRLKERMEDGGEAEQSEFGWDEPDGERRDDRAEQGEESAGSGFEEEPRSRKQQRRRPGRDKIANPAVEEASRRVKELYRVLVRKLHPDVQKDLDGQRLEWWHQAQAAYEAGDADQLEVILNLCEMAEKGAAAETSVSMLARITARFSSSLRALKRQLARCRRDPAWDFSRRSDVKRMGSRMKQQMEDELYHLKQVLREFEFQLEQIAASAKRLGRRRGRSTARESDWF